MPEWAKTAVKAQNFEGRERRLTDGTGFVSLTVSVPPDSSPLWSSRMGASNSYLDYK